MGENTSAVVFGGSIHSTIEAINKGLMENNHKQSASRKYYAVSWKESTKRTRSHEREPSDMFEKARF